MFLEKNRSRIEADYEKLSEEFPIVKAEIDGKIKECREETALALKYLYVTMPSSDIGNYDFSIFLDYAEHGVYLYENSPYVREMPEEIFLNYVLYHRINTEEIAPCRTLFYNDLKDRIQGMNMSEAALEINYWCAEKATYHTTDNRTAAPLTVYLCGNGRCGEESTFTISAMRSAGIPARQVYAPRWSHCDDNHAWVEVWCDGKWYFTGACEPEPILNKGWFTNASSRAMLVHSRWFDTIRPENEDIVGNEGTITILNQLTRYAAAKDITIQVKNPDGTGAAGVMVSLEIFNYAEFAPIARLRADEKGQVSMTTGLGSIHVTVLKDGLYGEALMDTRDTDRLEIVLGERKDSECWIDFDVFAPVDTPINTDQPTEEQKVIRDQRLARAAGIRTAKVEAFIPAWKRELVDKTGEKAEFCEKLMEILTDKDRIDIKIEVLKSHVEAAFPLKDKYPEEIFIKYVLNPRVYDEVLTDYRDTIENTFDEQEKASFRENPKEIWTWISDHIRDCRELEQESVYLTPKACLKLKMASGISREILFVAIARTLGIPARLNPVDRTMEYMESAGNYEKAVFTAVVPENAREAHLTLEGGAENWTYFQNWSIGKLEKDGYRSLDLFEVLWENGTLGLDLEPGSYRILTANRLPNGNIFGKALTFTIQKGEEKRISMAFRNAKLSDMLENISILPFHLLDKEGKKVPAADITREKRKILFWLEVSKEPTEHILNELMERREEFDKYRENLCFIVKKEEDLKDPTLSRCRNTLPDIQVLYDTFTENVNTLGRRMYVDPDKLPLILVTDGELNGVYATSGYNVGTADMLLRILEM